MGGGGEGGGGDGGGGTGGGGGGGGGGGRRAKKKEEKKDVFQRPPPFFYYFSFSFCPTLPPPPQPQCPVCLFLYFASLTPTLLPYQETPDCHAFVHFHEPPYPPLLIVLIARNLGTHRDALQRLKT